MYAMIRLTDMDKPSLHLIYEMWDDMMEKVSDSFSFLHLHLGIIDVYCLLILIVAMFIGESSYLSL